MCEKKVFCITLQTLLIALLVEWFLPFRTLAAEMELEGRLALRPGKYAFADYGKVFDLGDKKSNLTIEGWFYFTDFPDKTNPWALIVKPGSYQIEVWGSKPPGFNIQILPRPKAYTLNRIYMRNQFGNVPMIIEPSPIDKFSLRKWSHIALQLSSGKYELFFDGMRVGSSKIEPGPLPAQSDLPLFIGGAPGYASIAGQIDEIRISKISRYGGNINPPVSFPADKDTLALWRFDEGPWARSYKDASGNNYTLEVSGDLSVSAGGKFAMTWGQLKGKPIASDRKQY